VRDKHNNLIIIDSGSGIAELGGSIGQDAPLNAHLLITHTHLDHIQGFPFFSPAFTPGTHLTIVGPAGSAKSLQAAFADQMDPAYFPVRLDHMPADMEISMFAQEQNGSLKELAAWCRDADLLVHDAQYSRDEYKTKAGFGHSTFEEALSLAEQANVQQLAFFHHDPQHSDTDIDALIEEALGNHRQSGGSEVLAFPAAEDQEIVL
jgi:ribonuclease BN (tRNA processing enzyme)